MSIVKSANLLLRFLLELCALAALGYWGLKAGRGMLPKIGLGLGAPLLAAVVWGIFVAPQSPRRAEGVVYVFLETAVLGSAAVALAATGHRRLAIAVALVAVINRILMAVWNQ